MKIYEYIKSKNEKVLKLFGFTIMNLNIKIHNDSEIKIQKFFGGLVTTIRVYNFVSLFAEKEIKVFGWLFLRRIEENNCINYYLLNHLVNKKSTLDNFKHRYFKYFDDNHDDIYIY